MIVYQQFLNDACKIRFKFYTDKESKCLKWRDLTGPKKKRLFGLIEIPSLFPSLANSETLQVLWSDFIGLVNQLSTSSTQCSPIEFDNQAKQWVNHFTSIYQCKDVTPYMHCLAMHTSQFLKLHSNLGMFNQQGLEKLNDFTTVYFQQWLTQVLPWVIFSYKPYKM